MERHIRLADRRGLLIGLKLSPVQEFAVELALLLDDRDKAKDRAERFKMALIGHDPTFWVEKFYAEQLGVERFETKPQTEDVDMADTTGTWVMPEISEDEFYAMERELAKRGGTLTVEDLEEGEWQ